LAAARRGGDINIAHITRGAWCLDEKVVLSLNHILKMRLRYEYIFTQKITSERRI